LNYLPDYSSLSQLGRLALTCCP